MKESINSYDADGQRAVVYNRELGNNLPLFVTTRLTYIEAHAMFKAFESMFAQGVERGKREAYERVREVLPPGERRG